MPPDYQISDVGCRLVDLPQIVGGEEATRFGVAFARGVEPLGSQKCCG